LEEKIRNRIFEFFIESNDFNGIPLRRISEEFQIDYKESIDLIRKLIIDKTISIQSSTNPHIIGFQHYPIDIQLKILEDAKGITNRVESFGEISISIEDTDFPICLYPSREYLKSNGDLSKYGTALYTKLLALAEPHLSPRFFEIEVLERYANDPRFDFKFDDYSGSISCKYDDKGNPIVREEDQLFLKTFGLGFDSKGNRLAVVYLRYLKDLTPEHQLYWKTREVSGDCRMLKEYHDNTVGGSWTFSYSIFSAFIEEQKCLNELSNVIFGINLFNKTFEKENRPKTFTFFFTSTLKNYNEFVMLLDKMISDNINKDFFKGQIQAYDLEKVDANLIERKPKGTLRLLEEWLLSTYNHPNKQVLVDIFKPFKKIRRERQGPAHRIRENDYDLKYVDKQKELINQSYSSIRALRTIFQQHPKAKRYTVPDWLENGQIKTF
jgi:hypothetical protein